MSEILTACVACGGRVAEKNLSGEAWPYRDIRDLRIDEGVWIPACTSCGESFLEAEESRRLGEALEWSYVVRREQETSALMGSIVRQTGLSQGEIEQILGVSTGYLTRVRHREVPVSPQTYRFLQVLHEEPYMVLSALSRHDESFAPLTLKVKQFHSEH